MKEHKYINTQKYSECQLVSAINAASHLGKSLIFPDSNEYQRLVDFLDGARDGGITNISVAYKYLGIGYTRIPFTLRAIKKSLDKGKPVEIEMSSEKTDWIHTALVVDYRGSKIKIPNGAYTSENGWVDWKKMYPRVRQAFKLSKDGGWNMGSSKGFRSFYSREPKIIFVSED